MSDTTRGCACARDAAGTTTSTTLCPIHADQDPCARISQITGRRRTGTIRRGVCTHCGWTQSTGMDALSARIERTLESGERGDFTFQSRGRTWVLSMAPTA